MAWNNIWFAMRKLESACHSQTGAGIPDQSVSLSTLHPSTARPRRGVTVAYMRDYFRARQFG